MPHLTAAKRPGRLLLSILLLLSGALVWQPLHAGPGDGLPTPPEDLDRSTPRRAVRLFVDSCREGDYATAAYLLDLRRVPPGRQAREGLRLARDFKFVLDQTLWIDYALLSDEATGEGGVGRAELGEIALGRSSAPILLHRVADRGSLVWVFTPQTVHAISELYDQYGAGWAPRILPAVFFEWRFLEMYAWQWVGLLAAGLLAFVAGLFLTFPIIWIGRWISRRTEFVWDDLIVRAARWPVRFFVGLITLRIASSFLHLAVPVRETLIGLIQSGLILATAWLASRLVGLGADSLRNRLQETGVDIQRSRGARTQLIVLRRVINIVIYLVAAALILTQFEVLRRVGVSLLASAGVAGVVIGLAAQKSISNLLAGVQLAITQPIRIGDTVIVENEWGWIEEINLTYVILKVWDLRRLVIPISRFLDSSFQNWSRSDTSMLGMVFLRTDFNAPLDPLRSELKRYVGEHKAWDGQVCDLVVHEMKETHLELRCLVSTADSGQLAQLRFDLREHMVKHLQSLDSGRHLPRLRLGGNPGTSEENS